jgi:ketosteroid isomerase-like protein
VVAILPGVPEQNVEIVERGYALATENWIRGRAGERELAGNPIWDLFDPEVVLEENALFPDADTYRGYDGVARWWNGFFEIYDEVRMEPRQLISAGDRVLALVHMLLHSRMGVELEQDVAHVWTLRDGKVVHLTGYSEVHEGFEAVDLPER